MATTYLDIWTLSILNWKIWVTCYIMHVTVRFMWIVKRTVQGPQIIHHFLKLLLGGLRISLVDLMYLTHSNDEYSVHDYLSIYGVTSYLLKYEQFCINLIVHCWYPISCYVYQNQFEYFSLGICLKRILLNWC